MFLIINTYTTVKSDSRINFMVLDSDVYGFYNFTGKIVFDLDLINGGTEQDKITTILKSIRNTWIDGKIYGTPELTSIIIEQKDIVRIFVTNDLYCEDFSKELSKPNTNPKILEIRFEKPISSNNTEPLFNAQGFYTEEL